MKHLYIIRHAQTLPAEGGDDKSRKLTPNGLTDAQALGKLMAHKNYKPDAVLCSPATRTRETLAGILESLGNIQTEFPDDIYNGGAGDLLHHLQQQDDTHKNILLVGHVPGVYELAALLAGTGRASLLAKLSEGYKPGTLSVLSCPNENWADIQPAQGELIDFQESIDYNAPATPARWT
ncbi:MAG: hypothetical protein DHS20C02_17920 [Micavibrio sp.]|nr:MAG: hypothetical protein DHS20C02_17920 [Micavibrio sp.]